MSPLLGAHMSVAGGLPRAVGRAVLHGCDALQIFSKNASRWRGRDPAAGEIREFRDRVHAAGLTAVVSHASYLINLAASDVALGQRSMDAMADEIDRADALGLLGVVLHPGCYTQHSEAQGLELVAERLTDLLRGRSTSSPMILLEHTAGQGTSLGATFGHIAAILAGADRHPSLGVCLDTCHLIASGYDIGSPEGYAATFSEFEQLIGFERLKVVHLNDSKRPLGIRVDRHTHIGEGCLGLEPFRRLLNDARVRHLPMLIETPKDQRSAKRVMTVDRCDRMNLDVLRSLIATA